LNKDRWKPGGLASPVRFPGGVLWDGYFDVVSMGKVRVCCARR